MNYKNIIIDYFDAENHGLEFESNEDKEGFELAKKFFEIRFSNALKQYNNDSKRAFDFHMTKQNLELFRYFIEETYLLGQKEVKKEHENIRKMMRNIHNHLQIEVNSAGQ